MGAAQRGDIKHARRNPNGRLPSKVGISLPEQFHKSSIRTPPYLVGLSNKNQSNPEIKNKSVNIESDPTEITYIQIGDPDPVPFVQLCNSKIPELPAKIRVCTPKNKISRPSTALTTVTYSFKNDDIEKNPGLTMKYFGESGNVTGCFTAAKIPIQKQRPSTAIKPREEAYRRLNGLSPFRQ